MADLSDVERDALQVLRALARLTDRLGDTADEPATRQLQDLAAEGTEAADRVLTYLRRLRGPGDGEATAYPARLGPWREWCPPRGNLLRDAGGGIGRPGRPTMAPRPGPGDPGE